LTTPEDAGQDQSGDDPSDLERIDPAVVATLYLEYGEKLKAFLIGLLRNGDLAGEALQATFTKAVEVGHTARQETIKGWLFRVAYNEAMAIRRRQKIHRKSIIKLAWSRTGSTELPEESISRWETVSRVRSALETLPDNQQTVVRMRIYDEKTFAVIAEELRLPLGTVLTRMRLALQKLEKHFNRKSER
jgi:RNA polymerase sigma-70 factor (ECF subfamily)